MLPRRAVQTARDLIDPVIKLSARVQRCHYHLNRGFFLGFVDIDRYAAAVVYDAYGIIGMYMYFYGVAISAHRLINGIVHYFVNQVM